MRAIVGFLDKTTGKVVASTIRYKIRTSKLGIMLYRNYNDSDSAYMIAYGGYLHELTENYEESRNKRMVINSHQAKEWSGTETFETKEDFYNCDYWRNAYLWNGNEWLVNDNCWKTVPLSTVVPKQKQKPEKFVFQSMRAANTCLTLRPNHYNVKK